MTAPNANRRRRALAALTGATLLAGLFAALTHTRGTVRTAARDVLRAETAIAATLLPLAPDTAAVLAAFDGRLTISTATSGELDEPIVRREQGRLVGRAALYDADAWDRAGTVAVLEAPHAAGRGAALPLTWTAAGLVVFLAALTATRPIAPWIFLALSGTILLPPLVAMRFEAVRALDDATDARLDAAVRALGLSDLDALRSRPGGVYQLTGVPFLERRADGTVDASTLPAAATDELAVQDAQAGYAVADRVRYAVRDVGPIRLALVPYAHRDDPTGAVFLAAAVSLALAFAWQWLASLARREREFRRHVVAWAFLAPALLHLAVFTVGPLLFAGWLSFHRWSLLDAARPFVGLENYRTVLTDGAWWRAMANTAVYTLHVPVAMGLALAVALLLRRQTRWFTALRAVFFLPGITSLVAVAVAWTWMFHGEYGLINWLLSWAGVAPLGWLSSPRTALLAIMIMSVWLVIGYQTVLVQAGLTAIPGELYDAARMDGAGPWRRFWHVTLPGLAPTLFFVLVTSIVASFQVFGAVYVMTEGGPLNATDVAVFHIYEEAWEFFRFGSAAAMSWVLFAVILGVTWLQFRFLERRVEEA